jgi:transcriptional regulator with XRE-family HTH domain
MTQIQLAEVVDFSQPVIAELEAGKASGSSHLIKIAAVLSVDPFWLDSGECDSGFSSKDLNKRELGLIRLYRLLSESDKKIIDRIVVSLQECHEIQSSDK